MGWFFTGRNSSLSFVYALLLTLCGGLSVLTPSNEAYAFGGTITTPEAVFDTPPAHDATTGTMAGQAGTDGGASTYRVPIVVPPGRAGMQPSLSLSYNSRGGDGIAGMGWSISGLSSIHRCPQTPEQDGATRGVSYTSADRLCLDGQRLVSVNGSYGASGTTYKTEIDSYARITQYGGALTGDSTCFKVEQKDGRILHYGAVANGSCAYSSANARVTPTGTSAPLSWLVEKIEDRVGNYESFNYTAFGNGENLLQSISYTGSTNAVGNRKVEVTYQTRDQAYGGVAGSAKDIASSSLAGGLTMQTRALASIRTTLDGSTVRKYTPHYEKAQYSGRLLMTSMQECAGDISHCHPATLFSYNDGALNFQLKSLEGLGLPSPLPDTSDPDQNPELSANYRLRLAGDFDGDGTREAAVSVHSEAGTSVYLTHFTADRKAHLTIPIPAPYNQLASDSISDADMDGSGRSALIGLHLHADNVAFGLWDYNLFARGTPASSNPFGPVYTNIPLPETPGFAYSQKKTVIPADVDGDGKTDILTIHPSNQCNHDSFGDQDGVFFSKILHKGPLALDKP